MTDKEQESANHILAVLSRAARKHPSIPETLVEKIMKHESAVQFDEKRFKASSYIASIVFEHLESEV